MLQKEPQSRQIIDEMNQTRHMVKKNTLLYKHMHSKRYNND